MFSLQKPKYTVLGQINLNTGQTRATFEEVYPPSDKLFNLALKYYLTENEERFRLAMCEYHAFLASAGWTEVELDRELLEIIDRSWEI